MEVFPFLHLRDIVPSFPDFLNSGTEGAAATGTDAATSPATVVLSFLFMSYLHCDYGG